MLQHVDRVCQTRVCASMQRSRQSGFALAASRAVSSSGQPQSKQSYDAPSSLPNDEDLVRTAVQVCLPITACMDEITLSYTGSRANACQ